MIFLMFGNRFASFFAPKLPQLQNRQKTLNTPQPKTEKKPQEKMTLTYLEWKLNRMIKSTTQHKHTLFLLKNNTDSSKTIHFKNKSLYPKNPKHQKNKNKQKPKNPNIQKKTKIP